jgi:hypothetical protein
VHTPLRQSPAAQSLEARQCLVAAQRAHDPPPPQSTSVSALFFTPSLQLAAWQTPPVQTAETQSELALHALPLPHTPQVPPPQSTSVSAPFLA